LEKCAVGNLPDDQEVPMSLEHNAARQRKTKAAAPPGALPLLLTISRAAHELGVSERRVYELVHAGVLHMTHVGERASRITRDSLLALAAKRSTPRPVKNFAKVAE
jgi:excisionase family DNA binding protein